MFWTILIIVVIIIICNSGSNSSASNNQAVNNNTISCTFNGTGSYSSVLNRLENDVYYIAKRARYGDQIRVAVSVKKIDNVHCSVDGSFIADTCFRGVNFLGGYNFDGTDYVRFGTNTVTGFTSPEDVKREMLLQFKWNDLPLHDAQISIVNSNLVIFSFIVRKD